MEMYRNENGEQKDALKRLKELENVKINDISGNEKIRRREKTFCWVATELHRRKQLIKSLNKKSETNNLKN